MKENLIFEGRKVEVFEWNGKVFFNPYHCGECLDLAESSVRNYLATMNNKQAVLLKNSDVQDKDIRKLNNAGEKFLAESGVYKLIFKSHKPDAEKFQDWVTDEVLPTIQKHGAYMTPQKIEEILLNPDTIIKLATDLKAERKRNEQLQTGLMIKDQIIMEMNPKATYYDLILQCRDLISVTEIAKDYGKSAKWLNSYLAGKQIQFRRKGIWFLYAKYAEKGYTQSKTNDYPGNDGNIHSKPHTYWTQKGRLFIYDLLRSDDILPTMERDTEKVGA